MNRPARRLAVFGALADPQTTHVVRRIRGRGHQVVSVAPELWTGDGVEMHTLSVRPGGELAADFGGEDPLGADAAWVRHLPPPFPLIDTRPELPPLERQEAFVAAMNARERSAAVLAVLDALLMSRRPVINPPARGLGIQNKVSQLVVMAAAGARVPDTVVTDDPEAARRFAQGRRVVYKPVTGGALAAELDEAMRSALDLIVRAPVMFQQWIPGDDVRVTLVDRRVVSAVVVLTPEGTLDYRSDPDYAAGRARYREVELPEAIRRAVCAACEALELRLAGVDVRIDPRDPAGYAVLEANPSPTYLDIELKLGHPITDALVDALAA